MQRHKEKMPVSLYKNDDQTTIISIRIHFVILLFQWLNVYFDFGDFISHTEKSDIWKITQTQEFARSHHQKHGDGSVGPWR